MPATSRTRHFLYATFAAALLVTGCSSEKKAAGPRAGSQAYTWHSAQESWKLGDYTKSSEHLSRLATGQSEYREKAQQMLLVAAAGVAKGYSDLADAYEAGARANRQLAPEYRNQATRDRNEASRLAMLYAETIHETLNTNKDLKFAFEIPFPAGTTAEPLQLSRVSKGIRVQAADHEELAKAMASRGVVRFAAALAGQGDIEKAKTQFANPPRETALAAVATSLLDLADLYGNKKLDMPKRGSALCTEAKEIIELLPANTKARKDVEKRLKEQNKRFPVAS